ncbi:condensation domain-containing protein [Streptomyces sp. NPDC050504]|uniref:condensation domain-containing protein n=1 Tax=Streptomyces sp. NPDC050504 TaxID=3365618 RepID=UPI0037B73859
MSADALDRLTGLSPAQRALLAKRLAARAQGPELRAAPRDGAPPVFPMTSPQRRLWLAHQVDPGSARHHVPLVCDLYGDLDRAALAAAVGDLVERHEVLRTRFAVDGERWEQRVRPASEGPVLDVVEADGEERADDLVRELSDRPFDLTRDAPLRAALLVLGPRRVRLVLVAHHIVFDAWSERLLWDELGLCYAARVRGRAPAPAVERPQFGDYARWQAERADAGAGKRHLAYWQEQLAGAVEHDLPADRPRPPVHDPAADRVTVTFERALSQRLRARCREAGVTVFTGLFTAFAAVLHRWTGADDLVVGSLVSGRTHPLAEHVLGPFVNTVALRSQVPPGATLGELLERQHATVLAALSHQDAPFERVVDAVRPLRDAARHPLFQVLFQVDGATTESMDLLRLDGVRVDPLAPEGSAVDVDLVVGVTDDDAGLTVVVEYRTDLYDRATAARLADHLRSMVAACADRPELPVADVDLGGPDERALRGSWGNPPPATGSSPLPVLGPWGSVLERPLPGHPARILDSAGRPVPVGAVGELSLDGSPTGRLARFTTAGQIELHGRVGQLADLEGVRVDPGRIEAALAGQPGVSAAAVRIARRPDGRPWIVGYVAGAAPVGDRVREAASRELPGHLLPAVVVVVDAIPSAPDGAPDLSALPLPDPEEVAARRRAEGAPAERERTMAALIAGVLHRPDAEVGPDANFFDLGGDSILALQLVARAREEGLALLARDVFRHPTAAGLARVAGDAAGPGAGIAREPRSAASGAVPLTPIMHWLRELGGPVDHYHQSVLLQVPAGLRGEDLRAALGAVLDCHDVLRARLVRAGGRWSLEVPPYDAGAVERVLRRVDVAGPAGGGLREVLDRETAGAQGRLAVEEGVMVQAVWFDAGHAAPGRLLLLAHHLVVDTVSWRIVTADLAAAHAAAAAGRAPALQRPAASFRGFARHLLRRAEAPEVTAQLPYWSGLLERGAGAVTDVAPDPARDVVRTARSLTLSLSAADTGPLLTEVPAAYRARVDEVLLAALALAVGQWRGERGRDAAGGVLVDVEGHGRHDGLGLDLSRTVGWFTAVHPVLLDAGAVDHAEVRAGGADAGHAVKRVKEQLRAVPDDGIGHGLLRHLNAATGPGLSRLPAPELAFNYLGRFSAASAAGTADWGPAPEQGLPGGDSDLDMPLAHPLELTAAVRDEAAGPVLSATWTWADAVLDRAAVAALAESWRRCLAALARHARGPGAGGLTPSDLPLAGLSQKQIDQLEAAWRTAR